VIQTNPRDRAVKAGPNEESETERQQKKERNEAGQQQHPGNRAPKVFVPRLTVVQHRSHRDTIDREKHRQQQGQADDVLLGVEALQKTGPHPLFHRLKEVCR
jgi:2'-5' RNA ligase